MIRAIFFSAGDRLTGFSLSGHGGCEAADGTGDVVCAAVSSAAQLTANAVTDFLGGRAKVSAGGNNLTLRLENDCPAALGIIEAFRVHLGFIEEEYPRSVEIIIEKSEQG